MKEEKLYTQSELESANQKARIDELQMCVGLFAEHEPAKKYLRFRIAELKKKKENTTSESSKEDK